MQERNKFYIEHILSIPKENKAERLAEYKKFKPKTEKEWEVIYSFLSECSSTSLQQSRMDCDNTFKNFFKSSKGTRKGKSGFPKYKSKKDNKQSYREPNVNNNYQLHFEDRYLKIPKN